MASWRRSRKCSSPRPAASSAASGAAQLVKIVYRVPELFFRNVIVVDERADIFQQTMNNRLKTFIAAGNI